MSEVNLHTPGGTSTEHCRRLWGVLGTAGEPVVHYCCAPNPESDADRRTAQRWGATVCGGVHRCTCGATTGEEGARLLCRYREQGAGACGRLITSVEPTPIGQVSMPCGHPVRMPGKPGATDRRNRRGMYGRAVNKKIKRQR
jgi:hypothetical protein